MKIIPTEDKILIQVEDFQDKTEGGLHLPTVKQQRSNFGVVIAVGPGKTDRKGKLTPMRVKPGQRVVFAVHAGTHIQYGDINYLLINELDILAILER